MKLTSLLAIILISVSVNAQEFTGIDEFFGGPGYYDNLEEALAEPMEVLYLDLGMQVPKLKAIPVDVYKFPNLKILDLSFNQIAKVGDGIAKLTNLESMNLNGNQYLTSVPNGIIQIPSLKELNIKQTGLSEGDKDLLKNNLPEGCNLIK